MKASSLLKAALCTSSAAVALLAAAPAHATLFQFNEAGELTDNFRITGTTGVQPAQPLTGGLSNSGWVQTSTATGSSGRASIVTQATAGKAQSAFTLSVYFQWSETALNVGDLFALGFGKADTGAFVPAAGASETSTPGIDQFHIGLGVGTISSQLRVRVVGSYTQADTLYNFTSGSSTSASALLEEGNWYYLEVDFARNLAETGYDANLRLVNSDADGVLGSNVLSYEYSVVNPDLFSGDVQAYLIHRAAYYGGATGFDNFNVGFEPIPEPAGLSMVLLGAAFLGWKLRKEK